MVPVDFNIELCHMYTDMEWGDEQEESLKVAKEVIRQIIADNKTFCCSVLIDDYHPNTSIFDLDVFVKKIASQGLSVDHLCFESKLVPYGEDVLRRLPVGSKHLENFRSQNKKVLCLVIDSETIGLEDDYDNKEICSCALLSASWTVCRLGRMSLKDDDMIRYTKQSFAANNLITILPKRYMAVEKKALEIADIAFGPIIKNVSYKYF